MKTKALISFAVTAKLICVFVFAYTKIRFSHDKAHLSLVIKPVFKGFLPRSVDRHKPVCPAIADTYRLEISDLETRELFLLWQ